MTHANGGRSEPENNIERSTTQARQGVTGHNVRYMLAAGITGIVVLFAIVYVIFFS